MASKRSDLSPYPSRYSPGAWITGAQYIVELVCEKLAKHKGKDLPIKFWEIKEWASAFRAQTRAVNQLCKKYDEQVIISVVKEKNIFSLRAKWVEQVIQQKQKLFDQEKKKKEFENKDRPKEEPVSIIKQAKRTKKFGSSKFDKLLALDEEQNGEKESD